MRTPLLCLVLACSPVAAEPSEEWTQAELEAKSLEIQGQLEELRGERFVRPVEVRVASSENLMEYMKERFAKTESPEKVAADEVVAKLLAAIPADMDLVEATFALIETQVGGFYDPDTDSFSLMNTVSRALAPMILAHELDHALDDQLFSIDGTLLPIALVTDRATAFSAVVEGSGMNVMTQWQMQHGAEIDMSAAMEMQAEAQAGMADAPMWMWKPLLGVYMRGSCFLTRTDNLMTGMAQAAPPGDIRAAFEHPPLSTEQVLHPEKYWDPARRDDPVAVAIDTSALPADWKVLREDVLGELMLAIVLTPGGATQGLDSSNPLAAIAIEYTNDRAAGWGGDALVLVGSGEGRFLRLVTAWDSARDAGEFYGGLQALLPQMESAAAALSDRERNSGVTLEYGSREDVVVFTSWFSIDRRAQRKLDEALTPVLP